MTTPLPPPMPPLAYQTPTIVGFRDRSRTLLTVGIFFIIAGAICGCLLASTPIALVAPQPAGTGRPPPRVSDILVAVLMYAVLAAALITMGLGSIRKRRWVRPVVIVLGWIGLVGGVMGMIMWGFTMPQMASAMRTSLPPGAAAPPPMFFTMLIVVMSVFMFVIYLVIPALLLWLFRPDDVRLTLEHYDPQPRWTDGVPLGVLGMCALLALGAVGALMTAVQGWVAAFGIVMGGVPARLSALAMAATFAVATWLCFRRRALGWWLAVALFVILPLAWATTLLRHDLPQIYLAMGRPEYEVRMMQSLHRRSGTWMALGTAVVGAVVLSFAWRVRNHFLSPDLQLPEAASPPVQ